MLTRVGVQLRREGSTVSLLPPKDPNLIQAFDVELPGDLSAAAFLLVAAAITQDSDVTVERVGLNPTRSGVLDVLRSAGVELEVAELAATLGEPVGRIRVRAGSLHASRVGGELGLRAIDEIPILAALAARSAGTTEFSDLGELRVKESDRIALTVALLRSFGVEATEQREGFSVQGNPDGRLRAVHVTSGGDHRIAMTAAVLGLVADGETVIEDVDCIATSFPAFKEKLGALGASLDLGP
jgi:3-phosphoshikimate 1-carboxyvinyltransferase